LPVNGKGTTMVNSCCYATTTVGTVVFFVVSSRGNNGPTQQSKCFLCSPVPGYKVRSRREIYDAKNPNHRNKDYTASVWRSIAEELQTTGLGESETFSFAFFPSSFAIF
jgi:hypothetical protein